MREEKTQTQAKTIECMGPVRTIKCRFENESSRDLIYIGILTRGIGCIIE